MSKPHDAIVVSGGPAGTAAAWHLYNQGVENVLLLDRAVFPREKPCGSGLTRKAQHYLDEMGALGKVRKRAYEVPKIYLVTPRGRAFCEKVNDELLPFMLVLNRTVLDHVLLAHIQGSGVAVREGVEVKELLKGNGKFQGVLTRDGERLQAKTIVMASGVHSRKFLPGGLPATRIGTLVGWFRGKQREKNAAYMFWDDAFLPFYGWIFPEADDLVNVGVGLEERRCNGKALRAAFEIMRSRYLKRYMNEASQVGSIRGYPIHYTYHINRVVRGNALFVGEAASLVDPVSGEGIAQALISGRIAARAISAYLRDANTSHLRDYEVAVREEFHRFPSMRRTKAFMSYRTAWRLLELLMGRSKKWESST
ncbi:MAG: NAD(P)/FAD-dependent oxidoreductase [Acidiferrobacterales bacterium]